MIQPLRAAHRRAVITLAVVLPAVLLIGLGARRPPPEPLLRSPALPASLHLITESAGSWQRHAIQTTIYGDLNPPNDFYVVLRPTQSINEPDLLVYWSDALPRENHLPEGARLLGAFDPGRTLLLPREIQPGTHLILYSLAHQSVVDSTMLEKLP